MFCLLTYASRTQGFFDICQISVRIFNIAKRQLCWCSQDTENSNRGFSYPLFLHTERSDDEKHPVYTSKPCKFSVVSSNKGCPFGKVHSRSWKRNIAEVRPHNVSDRQFLPDSFITYTLTLYSFCQVFVSVAIKIAPENFQDFIIESCPQTDEFLRCFALSVICRRPFIWWLRASLNYHVHDKATPAPGTYCELAAQQRLPHTYFCFLWPQKLQSFCPRSCIRQMGFHAIITHLLPNSSYRPHRQVSRLDSLAVWLTFRESILCSIWKGIGNPCLPMAIYSQTLLKPNCFYALCKYIEMRMISDLERPLRESWLPHSATNGNASKCG